MQPTRSHGRFVVQAIPAILVLVLSTCLLLYLGYSEARRGYPRLELDKLNAQGAIVKSSLDSFLLAGLPLKQFPGFEPLTTPLLQSDSTIAAIYVTDSAGQPVFRNGPGAAALPDLAAVHASPDEVADSGYHVGETDTAYLVSLDLRSKFEQVGQLRLMLPKAVITQRINDSFLPMGGAVLLLLALYAVLVWRLSPGQERWINIAYVLAFVLVAGLVIGTLVNLYTYGIQRKVDSLSESLYVRLQAPLTMGLNLQDFVGIDQLFADYRQRNPDLAYIALTEGSTVRVAAPQGLGSVWSATPNGYEFDRQLAAPSGASGQVLTVRVGVPYSVIYNRLWRSVKNFTALLLASILVSTLFVQLRSAFASGRIRQAQGVPAAILLRLVGPLYFLSVFADSLNNSFLPQHFRDLAQTQGLDSEWAAALFTIYFLTYALALVPAGRFSDRYGIRPLFLAGVGLTTVHLLILALTRNFYILFLSQALDGLGQGMLFIAVQAYILHVSEDRRRTQGAAIIVFGYNGGVFSAVAIGGLLAADPGIGRTGVFLLGAVLSVLVLGYVRFFIPAFAPVPAALPSAAGPTAGQSQWRRAFQDGAFLKTAFLIGIPTKIIMAGLISATLPILLARQQYATEDIAQILMFYSAGVLLTSQVVARIADRRGSTGGFLLAGTLASALGLGLTGLMGWAGLDAIWPYLSTVTLIGGLLILGIAHGFIQAPVITYVAGTPLAAQIGRASAISLYRLSERIGNVGGPLLISQLLLWNQENPVTLSWIATAFLLFAVLFALGRRNPEPAPQLATTT
jgi:MFS family permease